MAQIFISHSQRDEWIKNIFFRAFCDTNVTHIFKEYDEAPPTGVNAEIITRDIETSSAVFVLLSETVENLQHTKEWIVWECGRAKDKPIWVFEPYDSYGRITVTIPSFDHYVRFADNEYWRQYIHAIVASYDDRSTLGKLGATGLGWWMFGPWGLVVGALAGAAIFPSRDRPVGDVVRCERCFRAFEVHPWGVNHTYRCPACGAKDLTFPPPPRIYY